MKISVNGYNKDGTLGVYDQEVKEKDRSCLTEKEECTSWIFFAVMIIILAGLSYICLQGGLARGHFVQVKGEEGEVGCQGDVGEEGPSVQDTDVKYGFRTLEKKQEHERKVSEGIKQKKRKERFEAEQKKIIDKEIAEGKRLPNGTLIITEKPKLKQRNNNNSLATQSFLASLAGNVQNTPPTSSAANENDKKANISADITAKNSVINQTKTNPLKNDSSERDERIGSNKEDNKPVQAEGGSLAVQKPVQAEGGSLAIQKPVQAEGGSLAVQKPDQAKSVQKLPDQAKSVQKLPDQAKSVQKLPDQAKSVQKLPDQAKSVQKLPDQAKSVQKLPVQAKSISLAVQKLPVQAKSVQKLPVQAESISLAVPKPPVQAEGGKPVQGVNSKPVQAESGKPVQEEKSKAVQTGREPVQWISDKIGKKLGSTK